MITAAILTAVYGASFTVMIRGLRTAPLGFQDYEGFHANDSVNPSAIDTE